jgi:Flp pilus assembly protein TadD
MRYSLVADHYQYLALPALVAVAVGSASWLLARYTASRPELPVVCAVIVVLGFVVISQQRAMIFAGADNERLWRDVRAKNETDWLSRHNLAIVLRAQGRLVEAQAELAEAIDIAKRFADWDAAAFSRLADTVVNFGNAPLAVELARKAVARNSRSADMHVSLAGALAANHELPAALAEANQAIQLRPDDWKIYNNVGTLLMNGGAPNESRLAYEGALRIDSDCVDAHYNLGNLLIRLGDTQHAIQHLRAAYSADPYFADCCTVLASLVAQQGAPHEAIDLYRRAIELGTDNPIVRNNLGVLLAGQGDRADAANQFRRALELKPDYAEARQNLESVAP